MSAGYLAGSAMVIAIMVAGGLATMRAGASAPVPTLTTISAEQLSRAEVGLSAPPAASGPLVSSQTALSAALASFPGTGVRETVLATVVDSSTTPASQCLCYAISLTPTGSISQGPPGSPSFGPPAFLLAVIDASTGQFRFAVSG